ncbi:MAG: sigma-70 family RNA polymerase sigma factor [bacterium]|nr:sigma-70 family RNA polymerase sigma factor [bacterium]
MTIEKFIRKNRRTIQGTIEQFVDKETAKDIEQDVYMKLWKTSTYTKSMAYIKTVVINTCKDFFRSKNYKLSNLNNADDDELLNIRDEREKTEERTDNIFRQKQIKRAVDKLPPKLKEVVILFDIEELSQDEISQKLKCPVGTVKSRLFKARKLLYEDLHGLID